MATSRLSTGQEYKSPPPPLPPHHSTPPPMMSQQRPPYPPSPFDYNRQSLEDISETERSMGWHGANQRASMSDVKLTGHYDSDDEDMMVPLERRKRRSCCDKLCCGCCTCYPRWTRYLCCILGLLVLGLLIAVGVLVALFKKPTVSMNGLDGEPIVTRQGTVINMNFTLDISVDNPNVESITFEKIEAKAFYPGHRDVQIGGGELDDVHIISKGITDIKFPFGLNIDGSSSAGQAIVLDLFNKCGLTGGAQQKVTVDYDVVPTIRIAGIPISFTISNSANFDCPVTQILQSADNNNALSSA